MTPAHRIPIPAPPALPNAAKLVHLFAAFLLIAFSGCHAQAANAAPETGVPPHATVASVRDVGVMPLAASIRGRDGGYSARFGDRDVWLFGDTILQINSEDGQRFRSSTMCWTRDFDATDGLSDIHDKFDAKGAPIEFLPFTEKETKFNATCNRQELPSDQRFRYALWPGPIVVDPNTGKAFVFYGKLHCGFKSAWDFKPLGHSLAVWSAPGKPVERPIVSPGSPEPTLLFPTGDAFIGQGATIANGYLYAYGCETQGLSWPVTVARVKLADALDRSAWRFYAGNGVWSENFKDSVEIMQASPQLSVHWNEHLHRYLAIYANSLANTISIRTTERPQGPWSRHQVIIECEKPTDTWVYCGLGHPELAREGGKVETISYYRTTGFLQGEIRLVEVVFE